MVSQEKQIEHPGVVDRVEGTKLFVRVESRSACGNCHVRSHCGMTDLEEKVVEVVSGRPVHTYQPGQQVVVTLERSLGFKALLLGYVFPFVVLLSGILIMMAITGNELVSSLTGIGLMVPYYGWIYLIREKLRSHFYFRIKA